MAARPRLLVLQTLDLVNPVLVLLLLVSITITRNARCQAAAWGAGSGGSCGASGGCSGLGLGGTLSPPLFDAVSTLIGVSEILDICGGSSALLMDARLAR
jgi:hypothetical protein